MLCLQIEEKILPATAIKPILQEKIKEVERVRNRPVKQKEKFALKDEIIRHLLPRAFSKYTRLHAVIDTQKKWLILDTTNEKKAEQFIEIFKKSVSDDIYPIKPKKLSYLMAQWLIHQDIPAPFSIEKACVLYDPRQKNRVIRCQQQDLFSENIQAFLQEGCEVKQLALSWCDRIHFVLSETGSLHGIQYQDELTAQATDSEAETKRQRFDADFLIMTGALFSLLKDLFCLLMEDN
jgi:recombination associated protein RdgC